MTDEFRAVIEHEDHALGWGDKNPCVRTGEDTVVLDGSSKLVWLIRLPYKDVAEALAQSFKNVVVKVDDWPEAVQEPRNSESQPYISAVLTHVLFHGTEEERHTALSWVKEMGVGMVGDTLALAIRHEAEEGLSDATMLEAEKLLGAWCERVQTISSVSEEELKKLVLDMLENRIFTSVQCSDNELSMVFMPIALGALSVPDAALPACPVVPPKPEMPDEPDMPNEPARRKEPQSPKEIKEDPTEVARLEHEIRWNRLKPEALELYQHTIKVQNQAAREAYERKLKDIEETYQRELAEWEESCGFLRAGYEDEVLALDDNVKAWEEENAEVLGEVEAWEKLHKDWALGYFSSIGIIYEYYDKAMPRSCNGLPMFMSFHLLNRPDWDRVWTAYEREHKRREEIQV